MKTLLLMFLLGTLSHFVHADVVEPCSYSGRERSNFTCGQKATNFGIVYAAQWSLYLIDQRDTLDKHGSFHNWYTNPFRPHFDRDSFDYNIFMHSISGAGYFLWYRSRGYDIQNSFVWSFLSSLAFEFTIESATERPSYQDIYQTPVFGTVLGIGLEKASSYFFSLDTWYGKTLGYILNPFLLVPQQGEPSVTSGPIINKNTMGMYVSYKF